MITDSNIHATLIQPMGLSFIVVGGGLGGLAAAFALSSVGHSVHVVEKAEGLVTVCQVCYCLSQLPDNGRPGHSWYPHSAQPSSHPRTVGVRREARGGRNQMQQIGVPKA